jgi:hypothetical protein
MWLSFLALWTMLLIWAADARDLPLPNSSDSPPVVGPQGGSSPDAHDFGTARLQHWLPPNPAESQVVNDPQSSVDVSSIGTARAQYLAAPNSVQAPTVVPPQYFSFTASGDADSLGNRSVYVDSTASPFGIYQTGIRFRAIGDANWYRFVASNNPRTIGSGHYLEGGFLVGYGVWVSGFNMNGYVGPAFGEVVNAGVVTDRWGIKAVFETYAAPTQLTMLSSSVTYSTITNNLQVQAKAGLKIFGDVYFGPETKFTWQKLLPFQVNFLSGALVTTTAVSAQDNIATVRVGAHVSAVRLGSAFFAVSGGWIHDQQLGSGYYGSVGLYQPF